MSMDPADELLKLLDKAEAEIHLLKEQVRAQGSITACRDALLSHSSVIKAALKKLDTNPDERLAEQAESEIQQLKERAKGEGYSAASREALWIKVREWIAHPMFGQYPGMLRCTVLNEIQFSMSIEELKDETWQLIGELVYCWERDSLGGLMDAIRIASLEEIAEPPERPDDLRKLFKLAANPHTRWALFAAYENVPWRLRPHAHKYSEGLVTDSDCDDWLVDRNHWGDEVLMAKPRALPWIT